MDLSSTVRSWKSVRPWWGCKVDCVVRSHNPIFENIQVAARTRSFKPLNIFYCRLRSSSFTNPLDSSSKLSSAMTLSSTLLSDTCTNVRLEGPILVCDLEQSEGGTQEERLNLNDHLGNDNGSFAPGGTQFWETVQGLDVQNRNGCYWLFAELLNEDGNPCYQEINLDEYVLPSCIEFYS